MREEHEDTEYFSVSIDYPELTLRPSCLPLMEGLILSKRDTSPDGSFHNNSLLGQARLTEDKSRTFLIIRGQRRADLDLYHMRRWARNGFVSIPGNLGPREENDE